MMLIILVATHEDVQPRIDAKFRESSQATVIFLIISGLVTTTLGTDATAQVL